MKGNDAVVIDKIVYAKKYHRLTDVDIEKMKSYCLLVGIELVSIEEIEE